ncbi:MAG: GH3 auxin-responsive promoter family protein [Opitutus sp.]
MPVLPKPLSVLHASWQTARMARRLSRSGAAVSAQHEILPDLIKNLAQTAHGQELGIRPGMTYEEFRARVPLRDYDQLQPYFSRIKLGEANVLWPGMCRWRAASARTVGPEPKWLPITDDALAHFEKAATDSLLYYSARVDRAEVFGGTHLFLDPLLHLHEIATEEADAGKPAKANTDLVTSSPPWSLNQLAEPQQPVTDLSDWSAKMDVVIEGNTSVDITLISGVPSWLLQFAEMVRDRELFRHKPFTNLKDIWPNLECIVHHGVPIGPFHDELKRLVGPTVNFQEVYSAAEAIIAAQDAESGVGLRLIADAGVFYEFLPLKEYHESLPLTMSTKALPLEQVRVGEEYVLVLTTPAGLCRYVNGDIVRFTSNDPPRLLPAGRTQLRLNSFEENLGEKDLTDALVAVCQRHGWTIVNFHVAPLLSSSLIGQTRGRHEWWVELRPGTAETPTGPILAIHLDVDLQSRNSGYGVKRQRGPIEAPVVRLVMPGFFAHWMRHHDRWGGQNKMPRCRPDRLIADELSALACFNAD